jgi:paraquat-inducible protein A
MTGADRAATPPPTATGRDADAEVPVGRTCGAHGLYGCHSCGLVSRPLTPHADESLHCPRCGSVLSHERRGSLQRTWACTLGALLLYGPANALPIMTTVTLFGSTQHTILGGIGELWAGGDIALAAIVFIASIAVPLLKLFVLLLLCFTAERRSTWRSRERAQLYRLLQAVGHWSMLDVYVVVLLVGMVQFAPFAGVQPEPGLLAFGSVVVLSIIAAESFDPRMLWPQARTVPSPLPTAPAPSSAPPSPLADA